MKDKKILLVDDEVDILNLLEAVLKKEGFTNLHTATSGYEAIQVCKNVFPDLIVLDIMLPDIDGFEVCRRIREFSVVHNFFVRQR